MARARRASWPTSPIDGGLITASAPTSARASEEIDATGKIVAPGWVDIHTHYDGQATWDQEMAPSSWHGVTTVVMGNCGVGFAPAKPDKHDWLIGLMEGVEDIPGTALAEGMTWNWETFPEYLDELERLPRTVDVGTHVPHGAVRAYVMGERGARNEAPTETTSRACRRSSKRACAPARSASPPRARSCTARSTANSCPARRRRKKS